MSHSSTYDDGTHTWYKISHSNQDRTIYWRCSMPRCVGKLMTGSDAKRSNPVLQMGHSCVRMSHKSASANVSPLRSPSSIDIKPSIAKLQRCSSNQPQSSSGSSPGRHHHHNGRGITSSSQSPTSMSSSPRRRSSPRKVRSPDVLASSGSSSLASSQPGSPKRQVSVTVRLKNADKAMMKKTLLLRRLFEGKLGSSGCSESSSAGDALDRRPPRRAASSSVAASGVSWEEQCDIDRAVLLSLVSTTSPTKSSKPSTPQQAESPEPEPEDDDDEEEDDEVDVKPPVPVTSNKRLAVRPGRSCKRIQLDTSSDQEHHPRPKRSTAHLGATCTSAIRVSTEPVNDECEMPILTRMCQSSSGTSSTASSLIASGQPFTPPVIDLSTDDRSSDDSELLDGIADRLDITSSSVFPGTSSLTSDTSDESFRIPSTRDFIRYVMFHGSEDIPENLQYVGRYMRRTDDSFFTVKY